MYIQWEISGDLPKSKHLEIISHISTSKTADRADTLAVCRNVYRIYKSNLSLKQPIPPSLMCSAEKKINNLWFLLPKLTEEGTERFLKKSKGNQCSARFLNMLKEIYTCK